MVKFLVKVQWICSFFQIPWNHMQPQRERTFATFSSLLEISSSFALAPSVLIWTMIQIISIFPHQIYTVSFAPFRSTFQLACIFLDLYELNP